MHKDELIPPSMIRDLLSFSVKEKITHFRTLSVKESEVKIFFTSTWFLLLRFKCGLYIGLEKIVRTPSDTLSSLEGIVQRELGVTLVET